MGVLGGLAGLLENSWGVLGWSWEVLGGSGSPLTPPPPPFTQIYRFAKSSETWAGVAPERFFERGERTLLSLKRPKATQGDLR